MTVDEAHFEVMSTRAHVLVVDGAEGEAAWAARRCVDLERRWTRFAPSEVTRLNRRTGVPVDVSWETRRLVEASRTAWEATGGAFDPTILGSLEAAGYDRSIGELDPDDPRPVAAAAPAPGLGGVFVWEDQGRVMLPDGVAIDPGGIGKGLAADLVVEALLDRGAAGALVNLGGDTRVAGRPPTGQEWVVSVDHPTEARELACIGLTAGAVASSSRVRRRWRRAGVEQHHLIDPRTGRPADSDVLAATVVAGTGWWAEACTKGIVVAGSESGLAGLVEASAIVVRLDGTWRATDDLRDAVVR